MNKNSIKGNTMLLITAIIWGCAFVAQSSGMDYVGPFTFQGVRSLLGAAALIPVIAVIDFIKKKKGTYHKPSAKERKTLLIGGVLCGLALCLASCLQQVAICYTSVGKAGFITTMYILMVPILGLFLKKKVESRIWICIVIAIAGLYLLCIGQNFSINKGDLLLMACAVVFAIQILLVDYFSPKVDGVRLSFIEFAVTGVIASIIMIPAEQPQLSQIKAAWLPILYAGVCSTGIAYTLQIIGQKYTKPTVASLIMSLESVFATIGGVIILHQIPSFREWIGIALMFAAIIISQLPSRKLN